MKYLVSFVALLLSLLSFSASALQEGQAVPQCPVLLSDNAQKLDLADYKGKVVLIDFWAVWCGPCQKSMPFLNNLRNELHQKGFEVIAINVDEDSDDAKEFLKEHPVDYPVGFDSLAECPKVFDVKVMPSSYVMDKAGKLRKIHYGYRDSDQSEIRQSITTLIAE